MSWKSFVTAGLLCALASPAFAVPSITIVPNGTQANNHLNADGDWAWRVFITPDMSLNPDGTGTPVAAEIGLRETSSQMLSVNGSTAVPPYATPTDPASPQPLTGTSTGTDGDGYDTENPGNLIPGANFAWLQNTVLGGTGDCSAGVNAGGSCPVGIQLSTAFDAIFAALGSENFGEVAIGTDPNDYGNRPYIDFVVDGPRTNAPGPGDDQLQSDVELSGAYGGNARIAQISNKVGPDYITTNYDTYSGTVGRQAKAGDANLSGSTNVDDYQLLLVGLSPAGQGTKKWFQGDFTGEGNVNVDDYQLLLVGLSAPAYTVFDDPTLGAGGGGGGAVPEPASAMLMVLAGSMFLAWRKR